MKCRSQRLKPEKMQPSARSCLLLLLLFTTIVTAGNNMNKSTQNLKQLVREWPTFLHLPINWRADQNNSKKKKKTGRKGIVSFVVVPIEAKRLPVSGGFEGGFGVEKEVHCAEIRSRVKKPVGWPTYRLNTLNLLFIVEFLPLWLLLLFLLVLLLPLPFFSD